ncbi:hypothetical protein MPSEU_000072700 [Mayamaea pseudoterrestris]|nr:hypothetical protein MPSEU_000072700 [Mayamaea pseudoterrestris]
MSGERSIEEIQARIAALKATIAEAEGKPVANIESTNTSISNQGNNSSNAPATKLFTPKLAVDQVSTKSDPRHAVIQYAKPQGIDVVPTPLKSQNDDVDYSYAKDGSVYYTDKLEKQRNVWEKPAWAMGTKPLKTSEFSEQLRSGDDLARPITFFNGRDESESAEANGMIVNLSGSSGNRIKPVDSKIEWTKPAWSEKVNLRETNNGEKLHQGREIAKPIGGIRAPERVAGS